MERLEEVWLMKFNLIHILNPETKNLGSILNIE